MCHSVIFSRLNKTKNKQQPKALIEGSNEFFWGLPLPGTKKKNWKKFRDKRKRKKRAVFVIWSHLHATSVAYDSLQRSLFSCTHTQKKTIFRTSLMRRTSLEEAPWGLMVPSSRRWKETGMANGMVGWGVGFFGVRFARSYEQPDALSIQKKKKILMGARNERIWCWCRWIGVFEVGRWCVMGRQVQSKHAAHHPTKAKRTFKLRNVDWLKIKIKIL